MSVLNEDARRQLCRLTEFMDEAARGFPLVMWEMKTPFLRALNMCVEALRKNNDNDSVAKCIVEVDLLEEYFNHCARESVARIPPTADPEGGETPGRLARIPPTSGDNGPEDPTPVCR